MAPRADFVVERRFDDVATPQELRVQVRKGALLIHHKDDVE